MLRRPITVWIQRPDIDTNAGKLDMDGKALPPRIVPSLGALTQYIAGLYRVHGDLWGVQFEWSTNSKRQRDIIRRLKSAKQAGHKIYSSKKQIPTTKVMVTEHEPDLEAELIDGVRPTKEVQRERTLRALSRRMQFVGEIP